MTDGFTLRRARSEDAHALTDLILRAKRANGYDDAFMAACADELAMTPPKIAHLHVWLAEHTSPLGCVALDVAHGKIESFFIDPTAQRQGVGRALWQVAVQAARAESLSHLTLASDPDAVPFYEAMGFATIGETPSGSIPGRTLPLMRITL